jgi:uncharacterized protein with ATP-grasp and redox domains
MKTYLDCLPCLMRQALKAARAATNDEKLHHLVLCAVAEMIRGLPLESRPPELAQQVYRRTYDILGNHDPFREAKMEANQRALLLYPRLKRLVDDSPDPLLTACKLAIAGNSIDLGPDFQVADFEDLVGTALSSGLAINDYDKLRNAIFTSRRILYLGDNAGEIVFDRVLIEELHRLRGLDICFAVRDRPIINDVTKDDASAVGMGKIATVVSTGSDAPATILSECSREMLDRYHSADIIIAKGQGNYESLEGEPGSIFFLLRAKCELVAELLHVRVGDAILKQQKLVGVDMDR